MSELGNIKQNELELLAKASIYLRDKLLANDRNGPLVKLLNREIDLFTDELALRVKAGTSSKPKLRPTKPKTSPLKKPQHTP